MSDNIFDLFDNTTVSNNNNTNQINAQTNNSNDNSINPFDVFDPIQSNQSNQSNQTNQTNQSNESSYKKPAIKVTVPQKGLNIVVTSTNDSKTLSPDVRSPSPEITDVLSPTVALEIPEWWGHSLDSPINQKASYNKWNDDPDLFGTSTVPSSPITYTTDDINNSNEKKNCFK